MTKPQAYMSFSDFQEAQAGKTITEAVVRQYIGGRAAADADFRRALLADPRGTVETEIGVQMPGGLELKVHEETNSELHLVLPTAMELTPNELASVTGGWPGGGGSSNDDDTPIDFDDDDPG